MPWLVSRRWWLLAGAFALLLLGLAHSWTFLSGIPVVVLLLLLISIPAALIACRETPLHPSPR